MGEAKRLVALAATLLLLLVADRSSADDRSASLVDVDPTAAAAVYGNGDGEDVVKPTAPVDDVADKSRRIDDDRPRRRILGRKRRRRRRRVPLPALPSPEVSDGGGCSHGKKKDCKSDTFCRWAGGSGKNGVCSPLKVPIDDTTATTTTTAVASPPPPPRPTIQSRKGKYARGEVVVCDFENAAADGADWVGLYEKGAEVDGRVPGMEVAADWTMACGTKSCSEAMTSGAVSFPPMSEGPGGMYRCFLLPGDASVAATSSRRRRALQEGASFPVRGRSSEFEVVTAGDSDATSAPSPTPSSTLSAPPTARPSDEPLPSIGPSVDPTDAPPASNTSASPTRATYVPGDLTVYENDLKLSTGLRSRVLATVGSAVPLDVPKADGSRRSQRKFHADPDGGAVIEHPSGDGRYAYVSNKEERDGGVGAIYFDSEGRVMDYAMILEGKTSYNCGGGVSPWPNKTWLTCEEHSAGQVWEVDPWTGTSRETKMGLLPSSVDRNRGDKYEAVAYDPDARDPNGKYRFFITTDSSDGQVIRWTPNDQAIADAKASGNYSNVLTTEGTQEYLVVDPDDTDAETGNFLWSDDLQEGRDSASEHFDHNEGIDVHDGTLYFTCKYLRRLFVLDLDGGRYVSSSTENGAFDSQPDQVARIVGEHDLLYFCEDGGGACGVHARDGSSGGFHTILEAREDTEVYGTETTGLAFSPDKTKMIVSFQCCRIYEVWREDGLPFNAPKGMVAPALNIKYHQAAGPLSIYQREAGSAPGLA